MQHDFHPDSDNMHQWRAVSDEHTCGEPYQALIRDLMRLATTFALLPQEWTWAQTTHSFQDHLPLMKVDTNGRLSLHDPNIAQWNWAHSGTSRKQPESLEPCIWSQVQIPDHQSLAGCRAHASGSIVSHLKLLHNPFNFASLVRPHSSKSPIIPLKTFPS